MRNFSVNTLNGPEQNAGFGNVCSCEMAPKFPLAANTGMRRTDVPTGVHVPWGSEVMAESLLDEDQAELLAAPGKEGRGDCRREHAPT